MKRKKARQKGTPDTQEGEITTSELLKKSVRGKFMENKTKDKGREQNRLKQKKDRKNVRKADKDRK